MVGQAEAMNQMYRYQRYIYDLTRKYYLFGRDRLIRCLPTKAGDTAIEIGCGTARNLMLAARAHPQVHWYGLDASTEMLRTAQQNLGRRGYEKKIMLHHGLAEQLDYHDFGLQQPFDIIFFSYSLSLIHPWQPALEASLRNLKSGGHLLIVDFADQSRLPQWFGQMLQAWLACFGVYHDPALPDHLLQMQQQKQGDLVMESIGRDYAFLAHFQKY